MTERFDQKADRIAHEPAHRKVRLQPIQVETTPAGVMNWLRHLVTEAERERDISEAQAKEIRDLVAQLDRALAGIDQAKLVERGRTLRKRAQAPEQG